MIQVEPLFKNTQDALDYANKASVDDIRKLFVSLAKIQTQTLINMNFNVQVLNECIDEWGSGDEDWVGVWKVWGVRPTEYKLQLVFGYVKKGIITWILWLKKMLGMSLVLRVF